MGYLLLSSCVVWGTVQPICCIKLEYCILEWSYYDRDNILDKHALGSLIHHHTKRWANCNTLTSKTGNEQHNEQGDYNTLMPHYREHAKMILKKAGVKADRFPSCGTQRWAFVQIIASITLGRRMGVSQDAQCTFLSLWNLKFSACDVGLHTVIHSSNCMHIY